MGILDVITGMFGRGQPKLTIELQASEVRRGGLLSGQVTLVGKKKALPVTGVEISLVDTKDYEPFTSARFPAGAAVLKPGQQLVVPFEIQVPADIQPTTEIDYDRDDADDQEELGYEVWVQPELEGFSKPRDKAFRVLPELDARASEDHNAYHVLPVERHFRHSSVKGDFTLHPVAGGFVASWRDLLSARGIDGQPLWRVEGFGRAVAVNSDGTRLIASSEGQNQLAIFDAASGALLHGPLSTGSAYLDTFAWLADGSGIVASDASSLLILDLEGNPRHSIDRVEDGRDDPSEMYISSLAPLQGSNFIAADSNADTLLVFDAASRQLVQTASTLSPNEVLPSADGQTLVVDSDDEITLYDQQLDERASFAIPGKQGVRYAGQQEHACTAFKVKPHLSPGGARLALNDKAGALWLLDGASGALLQRISREVIEFIEDLIWVDEQRVIALTNDGRVCCLGLDGAQQWCEQDL